VNGGAAVSLLTFYGNLTSQLPEHFARLDALRHAPEWFALGGVDEAVLALLLAYFIQMRWGVGSGSERPCSQADRLRPCGPARGFCSCPYILTTTQPPLCGGLWLRAPVQRHVPGMGCGRESGLWRSGSKPSTA
jgi:hypothetical protein